MTEVTVENATLLAQLLGRKPIDVYIKFLTLEHLTL
jgi:hypothetical protein